MEETPDPGGGGRGGEKKRGGGGGKKPQKKGTGPQVWKKLNALRH